MENSPLKAAAAAGRASNRMENLTTASDTFWKRVHHVLPFPRQQTAALPLDPREIFFWCKMEKERNVQFYFRFFLFLFRFLDRFPRDDVYRSCVSSGWVLEFWKNVFSKLMAKFPSISFSLLSLFWTAMKFKASSLWFKLVIFKRENMNRDDS